MNYRWVFISASIFLLGLFLFFIYNINFSWVISVLGLIGFLFALTKKHDWYAG